MSLNTVIAFALLLKKITRKGSLGKKHFRNKLRKSNKPTDLNNISCSSSSDDEEDDEDLNVIQYNNNDYNLMNNSNKKSNSSIISPSIKSLQQHKHSSLKQPLEDFITIVHPPNIICDKLEQQEDEAITTTDSDEMTIVPTSREPSTTVMIRDFAYPMDSPLHYGKTLKPQYSSVSLSSPDFNGREARALFDFTPETEYELSLKTGQTIWVQYRQCPGWLIADVQDETGLIPESYVEFI